MNWQLHFFTFLTEIEGAKIQIVEKSNLLRVLCWPLWNFGAKFQIKLLDRNNLEFFTGSHLETSILQKCRLYDYFRRYDKEFLIIITEKFQETFLKYLNVKSTQFFINIRLAQFLYHYIPPTINISDNKK